MDDDEVLKVTLVRGAERYLRKPDVFLEECL